MYYGCTFILKAERNMHQVVQSVYYRLALIGLYIKQEETASACTKQFAA